MTAKPHTSSLLYRLLAAACLVAAGVAALATLQL
jgi:hypothetical protein